MLKITECEFNPHREEWNQVPADALKVSWGLIYSTLTPTWSPKEEVHAACLAIARVFFRDNPNLTKVAIINLENTGRAVVVEKALPEWLTSPAMTARATRE